MPPRHLINDNGDPFDAAELGIIRTALDAFPNAEREDFRNRNAAAIAQHAASQILVVSGPGTGKSTLFKQRIGFWLQNTPNVRVLALSFVRKLVADLQNDISTDGTLTDEQKGRSEVHTLHKYARRIVETNHGTAAFRFQPHLRIIGPSWKEVVWSDVLLVAEQEDAVAFHVRAFEKQLHTEVYDASADWSHLHDTYFVLSLFYNAAGFADLIIHARDALREDPGLVQHEFFIVDEYQDFNPAEDSLINALTQNGHGLLIVGDDDQVLYDTLKSGEAVLLRNRYRDNHFVNGMLPFCGRSSYHITKAAAYFIGQVPEAECIEKIFLPLKTDDAALQKVQVIACATPGSAVDYIRKFVNDHRGPIEERKGRLESGEEKDPYLLILTPARDVGFYASKKGANPRNDLFQLVEEFRAQDAHFSEDYYKVLSYYSLANDTHNNFTFRKVLFYERVAPDLLLRFLQECIANDLRFDELQHAQITLALQKCREIKRIVDSADPVDQKVQEIERCIGIDNLPYFREELQRQAIDPNSPADIEHREEEEAEREELEVKQPSAVELLTIVGAKGLSADHVIVVGFDNVNMSWISRKAFYVALTRARESLHLITALKAGGATRPHQYLDNLPDRHVEFQKYKKTNHQKATFAGKRVFLEYLTYLNSMNQGK